uniref:Uncharacterized protein n=1 Tax=Cucumis melo TaxID=3656 RepID=A0A9I9E9N3_CUCME
MPSRRRTHHRRPSCPARTLSSSNSPSTFVVLATTVEHKWRVKSEVSITPKNPALLGLNVGRGIRVKLKASKAK